MPSPIEDIKSRLDIVEFIQTYVRLQKSGMNFKAPCPFHAEKTPSFFVSPSRQTWHCFGGCAEGGDIFKFLMKIEGLDFPEALKVLAVRAGIELKREDPRIRSERNRLYDLCEEASGVFELSLARTQAVKAYLQKRGVTDESVKKFRLGFAPQSWDFLIKALVSKGFRKEEIERAGLAVRSGDGNSWYDRFRSRVIFPISDNNGRVIGFGGRILHLDANAAKNNSAAEEAKYINTPQTLIYDKSRALYGINYARHDIRAKNEVIIVEGYMDCLMSHQAGVNNTVAVSGTALTPLQLKHLKNLCSNAVATFDKDNAGDMAISRSLTLMADNFERYAAIIPKGKDVADLVCEDPELWRKAAANKIPFIEFFMDRSFEKFNSSTVEGRNNILNLVLPELRRIINPVSKSDQTKILAQRLNLREDFIWDKLKSIENPDLQNNRVELPESRNIKSRRELLEARLLALAAFVDGEVRQKGLKDHKYIYTNAENEEFFAKLSSGTPESEFTAEFRDRLADLRFQGEILAASTVDVAGEFMLSAREFEKECVREKLQAISSEIERKEKAGLGHEVDALLRDFRVLSDMLKNVV